MSEFGEIFAAALPLVVSLLSFIASVALLRLVCNLEQREKDKLIHRQLWHLSLADTIHCMRYMFEPLWVVVDLVSGSALQNSAVVDCMCYIIPYSNIPLMVSVAVELHMALVTFLTSCRLVSGRMMVASLPWAWLVGVICGGAIGVKVHGRRNEKVDLLAPCEEEDRGDHLKAAFLTVAVGICTVAYLASWATTCASSGEHVQNKVENRARIYVLAALVTWGPFVVNTLIDPKEPNDAPWDCLASTCMRANGLLNAFVYIVQSRRFRQEAAGVVVGRAGGLLAGTTVANNDEFGPQQQASSVSWRVGFWPERADDVILVPIVNHLANETSESETRDLQLSQGAEKLRQRYPTLSQASSFTGADGVSSSGASVAAAPESPPTLSIKSSFESQGDPAETPSTLTPSTVVDV